VGTPNVSGRDTPSSQLEGEDREQRPLDLMASGSKQNSEDIEDKFGKFEIHPMMEGDETKSMVSDTWSTDVLASDSETVEQSDISSQMSQILQKQLVKVMLGVLMFWLLTQKRLQDIDTDDTASVARSDDTARSEVDVELAAGADYSRLDSKDILDSDVLRDPFLSDAFGTADNQAFMNMNAQQLSSTDNYSREQASFDGSMLSERNMRGNISLYDSDSDCFKVPDLLCMDMDNSCNVEPLDPENSQSAHEESLSSMQSLGRVSLAVRELPDAGDQESGVMLLDSLQETVSMQNAQQAHRSSIVDILSLDLTRTLNLPSTSSTSADSAASPGDDVCPQFRAVSLSNSSSNGPSNSFGSPATEQSDVYNSRHMKGISAPTASGGAISKSYTKAQKIWIWIWMTNMEGIKIVGVSLNSLDSALLSKGGIENHNLHLGQKEKR
ncbi:receptor-mediated endocytosis protein 6, partial [Caerostris extrusa]